MIPDYYLLFFIYLILAWIFAGKMEYLLPQIALIAAILISTMNYIAIMTPDDTISDVNLRYTLLIAPILLYLANIFYVIANMFIEKPKKEEEK